MGRRKPAAAFSLFSFQDIVTSVTAILILVMLLLSIELVTKKRNKAASDPDTTRRQLTANADALESLAAGLRQEVTARRSKRTTRNQDQATRELARARDEVKATRSRLDETKRTQVTVEKLQADAEAVAATHAEDLATLAQLKQRADDDQGQADQIEKSNQAEKDRQVKRTKEIANTPRSGTELVYNPQADSDRRAWLVELSESGITAVLLGGNRIERLGTTTHTGSPAARWIEGLAPDGDYCLLLVRPSTSDSLEEEITQRLLDADISHGIDLIGEDQAVRDGSKPATRSF